MTMVNGNNNSRPYGESGVLTFQEGEVSWGLRGCGVGSPGGAFIVVNGRRLWFSVIVGYLL